MTIQKIALKDESAPGSDFEFAGFIEPIINTKRDVAFKSGSDGFFSEGVWISNAGVLRSLVVRGDEPTGITIVVPGAWHDTVPALLSFGTIGSNERKG